MLNKCYFFFKCKDENILKFLHKYLILLGNLHINYILYFLFFFLVFEKKK